MSVVFLLIGLFTILIFVIYILYKSIVVIKPHEEGVYIFMGNVIRVLKPGLNFISPVFSRVVVVDLRPQKIQIKGIRGRSSDSVDMEADMEIEYRIKDTLKSVISVKSYSIAVKEMLKTNFRVLVGEMRYMDIAKNPNVLREELERTMDKAVRDFGISVERIDITDMRMKGASGSGEGEFFNHLKGKIGTVVQRIEPYGVGGMVEIDGKIYSATSRESIDKGERIVVENPEILLTVRKEGAV